MHDPNIVRRTEAGIDPVKSRLSEILWALRNLTDELYEKEVFSRCSRLEISSWLIHQFAHFLATFEDPNNLVNSHSTVKDVLNVLATFNASDTSESRNARMASLNDNSRLAATELLKLIERTLEYVSEDRFVRIAHRALRISATL